MQGEEKEHATTAAEASMWRLGLGLWGVRTYLISGEQSGMEEPPRVHA
jgi:hypothetical protein